LLVYFPAQNSARRGGSIIALIKPQFEAGKAEVNKGAGVIKDPEIHCRVIHELQAFVSETDGLRWRSETDSPITGPKGNKEFLAWIEKE
jgi:23S rRNA (cytidine1920-2'-O)/16S rRNA (cytidine1409-2'-O)-methyltransferase